MLLIKNGWNLWREKWWWESLSHVRHCSGTRRTGLSCQQVGSAVLAIVYQLPCIVHSWYALKSFSHVKVEIRYGKLPGPWVLHWRHIKKLLPVILSLHLIKSFIHDHIPPMSTCHQVGKRKEFFYFFFAALHVVLGHFTIDHIFLAALHCEIMICKETGNCSLQINVRGKWEHYFKSLAMLNMPLSAVMNKWGKTFWRKRNTCRSYFSC